MTRKEICEREDETNEGKGEVGRGEVGQIDRREGAQEETKDVGGDKVK